MKAKINTLIPILLGVSATLGFSQGGNNGIYLTHNDYVKQKLTLACNCETEKQKIVAEVMFHPKELVVKNNGKTHRFLKDSVYAVRNCDGSVIRIYDNSEFPLINPNEPIMIYKVTSGGGGKGGSPVVNYFFSKDAKSRIHDLTILNLKKAFHDNLKFLEALDIEFKSDAELSMFDAFNKIHKLNHVYALSMSQ